MSKRLEKLLEHKDIEVRRQAIKDILKFESDPSIAIPLLIKKFGDESWRIRKTAVEVLLNIGGEAVKKAVVDALYNEDNVNMRNSAIEALVSLGEEATDYLIEAYKRSSVDVKKFIIDILGDTGDLKALPLLLKALEDKDENIRASVVERLGSIKGNASVITALTRVLESKDMWVAYAAADALGRIADIGTVDVLVSALSRKDLRKPAIRALGKIAESRSLASIVPFLEDNARSVREETVEAIAQFFYAKISEKTIISSIKNVFGAKASNILLPHTKSNRNKVRVAAVLLIGLLKDKKAITPLMEMSLEEDFHEAIVRALVFIGKSKPELLIPFFTINDAYQRRVVCEVAGMTGSSVFFKFLVNCLKDEDGHVRGNAAISLARLNDPKAIKSIKPLLLDEYENVQEEAVKSLSKFKKWIDLDGIKAGLSDNNIILRKNTAMLLGSLADKGSVEALGGAFKDSNIRVRVAVVKALGVIKGAEAVKLLLLALADESPEVRRISALAIGKMRSKKGIDPLIFLLSDTDIWVRVAAAEGLGMIGSKKAIDSLLKLLSDESGLIKTASIEALSNFKEERVKDAFLKLLNDTDAEIRSTAVESLVIFEGIAHDIIPLLKDEQWSVRKKVVDVLGSFFKDESYAYLKEIADSDEDQHVRETAARYISV